MKSDYIINKAITIDKTKQLIVQIKEKSLLCALSVKRIEAKWQP